MTKLKIAPSILAADYMNLHGELKLLETAGADWIHCDIMDGHFVPNMSFGPDMVRAIRANTKLTLDVHLMVARPADWIGPFIDAGADIVAFHVEAETHIQRQLARIRDGGARAGVVLNPATPLIMVEHVLEYCDLVLLMSVNPGYGGQKFLPNMLDKIASLRALRDKRALSFEIQVDGGITPEIAAQCAAAGATVVVAGSAVFNAKNPADMIARFQNAGL